MAKPVPYLVQWRFTDTDVVKLDQVSATSAETAMRKVRASLAEEYETRPVFVAVMPKDG